jgi:hypothetical protein
MWEETTEGSAVKQATYAYDVHNNKSDEYEYDWGSGAAGALLRHTHTDFNTSSSYVSANILDLAAEVKVYGDSGPPVSDTQYRYDETPVTNYQSAAGYVDPGTTRGNRTSVLECLNPSSCTWLPTSYAFDMVGNVVSVTDARGNLTTLGYSDNYADGQNHSTFAHITSLKNALNQTETWQWDFGNGKVVASTDFNGFQTVNVFNDSAVTTR